MNKVDNELMFQYGNDICANNNVALRNSATNGHLSYVIRLLECGANVRACNDEALRFSAKNGHTDVVTKLLEYGANVHAFNDEALRYSAKNGHVSIVIKLLEHGANVHASDDEVLKLCVYRYLHIAHVSNYKDLCMLEIIAALLEHGANIYSDNSAILENVHALFDEKLADTIFGYCYNDDYCYFPSDYIQRKTVPTKSARKN